MSTYYDEVQELKSQYADWHSATLPALRLVQEKHQVRVFARTPGAETDVEWARGDLATGDGLAAALRDVHTVINAATYSPIARRGVVRPVDFFRSPSVVDVDGTRRLLALSERAGVRHFLH